MPIWQHVGPHSELRGDEDPEGVVAAMPGQVYTKIVGGTVTQYVKGSGTGMSGWTAANSGVHTHPWSQVTRAPAFIIEGDSRLTDSRSPTAHVHGVTDLPSVTSYLDSLSTTRGAVLRRGAAGWEAIPPSSTVGFVLTSNGTNQDPTYQAVPASGGGPSLVQLTNAQTAANATLANLVGLSFSLTANVLYQFTFFVTFRSTLATVGLKIGLTFPTATRQACVVRIPIAGTGAGGESQGVITVSGGSVVGSAVPAINTDYLARADGMIRPLVNGTIQLQFAAETTGLVTAQKESCGMLTTVP